jgi:hypothetical protein
MTTSTTLYQFAGLGCFRASRRAAQKVAALRLPGTDQLACGDSALAPTAMVMRWPSDS